MAKLANIVREHVKFDMFANNVAQFGHHVGQQIQVEKCSRHVCRCSKHFREHLLFDRMLSNLATMFANNSTQSGKSCARIMQKSFKSIATSTSFSCKMDFRLKEKGLSSTRVKIFKMADIGRAENRSTTT